MKNLPDAARWAPLHRRAIAILIMASFAAPAAAQDARMVAQAMRDYAAVVGGVHLNERCHFLDPGKTAAFGEQMQAIRTALFLDERSQRMAGLLEDAAREEAASDKYAACDDAAKLIVDASSTHAHNWSTEIAKLQAAGIR